MKKIESTEIAIDITAGSGQCSMVAGVITGIGFGALSVPTPLNIAFAIVIGPLGLGMAYLCK
jgi:hypothetical protein